MLDGRCGCSGRGPRTVRLKEPQTDDLGQNLSSAAAGVAPKVRAAEDNAALRRSCSGGCGPRSPVDCNILRHATEPSARIGISNGWLSEEIPFIFLFQKRKMWNDADGLCFWSAVRRRRRTRTSRKRVAVRRKGAAANCAAQRAAYVVMEKFSGRGLRGTQRCECRCGPPLAGGCGPRDSKESHLIHARRFAPPERRPSENIRKTQKNTRLAAEI